METKCKGMLPFVETKTSDGACSNGIKPLLCDVRELLQMIDKIPCNCIEAYKSRGLSDPDCPRCNYVDDDIVGKVRAHFA